MLKPYVRRDYESVPLKLDLLERIVALRNRDGQVYARKPIDYVHLRPEHVVPINVLCSQHFWNGIDISECLDYSEHTIVALYGKLVVGFAFLVPNVELREAYISFIFVHPDWRSMKQANANDNEASGPSVSIAQYMMFYLIEVNSLDEWKEKELSKMHITFRVKFVFVFAF